MGEPGVHRGAAPDLVSAHLQDADGSRLAGRAGTRGIRAIRCGRRRGDDRDCVCGLDGRAAVAAPSVCAAQAAGLRRRSPGGGRAQVGRASAAGGRCHDRRPHEDPAVPGAALLPGARGPCVRAFFLRHFSGGAHRACGGENPPALPGELARHPGAGPHERLLRCGRREGSGALPRGSGTLVARARRHRRVPPLAVRVITLNVNGVRSAAKKGLFRWLAAQRADVVCLQEMKCQEADLDAKLHGLKLYQTCHAFAEKKGYSGVAIYSRTAPDEVNRGFSHREFDPEGRYVEARFGKLWVVSVYLPSGSAGPHRQASKFRFLKDFILHLKKLRERKQEIILCGDWNIAHQEIDLKNWRSNQKNSGFLPQERAWLTRVFEEIGFVDVFRRLNDKPDQYTWWSNRGRAWAKNVGWRLDYQIATPGIAATALRESIYKRRRFSDHAPLTIDYDHDL